MVNKFNFFFLFYLGYAKNTFLRKWQSGYSDNQLILCKLNKAHQEGFPDALSGLCFVIS